VILIRPEVGDFDSTGDNEATSSTLGTLNTDIATGYNQMSNRSKLYSFPVV